MLRLSFRRMGLRPSGALRPVWARELAKKAGKSVRSEPARSSKSEPGEEGGEGPDLEKVASQMERSLSKLLKDFYAVQVGRATPAMLEAIQVRSQCSRHLRHRLQPAGRPSVPRTASANAAGVAPIGRASPALGGGQGLGSIGAPASSLCLRRGQCACGC
eukprot:scaffold281943_cov31-Tisochrysis_lutea.AAC.1